MAKKLIVKEEVPVKVPVTEVVIETPKIHPITQEFGNGDLNVLRDKINEIIRSK